MTGTAGLHAVEQAFGRRSGYHPGHSTFVAYLGRSLCRLELASIFRILCRLGRTF